MRQVMCVLVSWLLVFQLLTLFSTLPAYAFQDVAKSQMGTSVPFTVNRLSHAVIIPVQINGHEPLHFIVDTGVDQPVIIEKWAADKLNLVPTGDTITVSPGNKRLPLTSLRSLLLKSTTPATDSEYTSVPASIDDVGPPDYGGPRIAGVLGLPLFFRLVMQLDFSQNIMHLTLPAQADRTQFEPNASYLTLVQPDENEARYFVAWPVQSSTTVATSKDSGGYEHIITSTSTDTYNLWLDTGANSSCLPETVISFLHPVGMTAAQVMTAAGLSESTLTLIPSLRSGAFVIPNLFVRRSDPKSEVIAANALGMDVLRHFRVTFDFPNKQLILDEFDKGSLEGGPATTGIRLEKRGASFYVLRILSKSPAEKALVHVGDQITQVDDQILSGYNEEVAQTILDSSVGTNAKLVVLSTPAEQRHIEVERVSRFDSSLYPGYGFLVAQRALDNAILVGDILCSSPAWSAGLRAGDKIVQVNGVRCRVSCHYEQWID